MKINYFLITLILFISLAACAKINSVHPFDQQQAAILLEQYHVAKPSQQMIALPLPHPALWKKIDIAGITNGTRFILIPKNDSSVNWNESIRTQISGYANTPRMTALTLARKDIHLAVERCLRVNSYMLAEKPQYVIYQLDSANCKNDRDETQMVKVFNGRDAVYLIRYTAITTRVSSAQINRMSRIIQSATLVANPRYKKH